MISTEALSCCGGSGFSAQSNNRSQERQQMRWSAMEEFHTSAEVADITRRDVLKFGVAGGAAATLWTTAPALGQRARAFRFGHMLPADTLYHKSIQMFADEANKLSSGKIKVDIYPSSQ